MRLLCPIWAVAVLPLVSTSCRNGRFDASAREQTDNVGKVVAAAECFCAQGGHYPGSLHELNGFHCEHPFARMDYDPTYFEWVNFTPQPDGRLDVRWKPKNGRGNGMGFIAVYPRAATQPANAPSTRPVLPIAATGPARPPRG